MLQDIFHNSFNIDDYKNGMEQIKNATAKLSEVWKRIRRASNYHIGSHGGDYYFADEQSNVKDCERYPATKPEFGNTRKCTPFEKKDFAGRANVELEQSHYEALSIYGRLLDLKDKVKGGNNE